MIEKCSHKPKVECYGACGASGVCKTKEHKDINPETAWNYLQLKMQTQSETLNPGRQDGRIRE